jgi:hypothetical protein
LTKLSAKVFYKKASKHSKKSTVYLLQVDSLPFVFGAKISTASKFNATPE